MLLHMENPKEFTQKLLELKNELIEVAWYKINIQQSVAFLYTNNEISEKNCKKKISFKIASKNKIKYLRISLTKEVKDLYAENYKTLIKDIEYASTRWKDNLCSWIRRIKMPKAIYRFNVIPIKLPMTSAQN